MEPVLDLPEVLRAVRSVCAEVTRPLAAEVLVDGDQEALIRRRQQITELIGLELDGEEPAPT